MRLKIFLETCDVLPFSCTHLASWRGERPKVHAKQKGFTNFFSCAWICTNGQEKAEMLTMKDIWDTFIQWLQVQYNDEITAEFWMILKKILEPQQISMINKLQSFTDFSKFSRSTAKRKLERLQFSTSSSFVKIWSVCCCEFKAYFLTFWALYHLLFDLETNGVH